MTHPAPDGRCVDHDEPANAFGLCRLCRAADALDDHPRPARSTRPRERSNAAGVALLRAALSSRTTRDEPSP